jgi:gliding motility-associated-like protein
MTNNAPGGIGNDLALDDITFRPCGPYITSTIVGYGDSVAVCEGQPNVYSLSSVVSSGFNSPVHQWQVSKDNGKSWSNIPGATGLTYTRPSSVAGRYLYRLSVSEQAAGGRAECSVQSNVLLVDIQAPPAVNAGPDRTVLNGNAVVLQGSVSGNNATYVWRPPIFLSDTTVLDPTARPTQDQQYTLHAISALGCSSKDDMLIRVANGIYVPNAFTPNKDGVNDHWRIPFLDPGLEATVRVYNRYGAVVYEVIADNVDWDGTYRGKLQASGTYVYNITFKDGRSPMKGTITLIR